jgi:hypothetical protein
MKSGMIMMGVLFVLLRRLNKVQGDRLPVWELEGVEIYISSAMDIINRCWLRRSYTIR